MFCMYKKLKEIRYKNHMTTKVVSEKVGISKAFYCQIENGKRRMTYELAIKIASVFKVKPDYLFYDDMVLSMNKLIEEE